MDFSKIWEEIVRPDGGTIIYVIMDGVGGLPLRQRETELEEAIPVHEKGTELEEARSPNLDELAKESSCGLLETVGPGLTPGSGPGHLALFGYNPVSCRLGRGILSALGINFDLKRGDVAARINFATVDRQSVLMDRRAGRIDSETNRHLCSKIMKSVKLDMEGEFFLETVSEHRAVFILRGSGIEGHIKDTDPQRTGLKPIPAEALDKESEKAANIVNSFIQQAKNLLAGEEKANMILMRGFDTYEPLPTLESRFGLKGICIAQYPMYRGISRLLGLDIAPVPDSPERSVESLEDFYKKGTHDFYFLHFKKTDSAGEDGDYNKKVDAIEQIDALMPRVASLNPDVLVVTADHSTPALMGIHSWHPVPLMIRSRYARVDSVNAFHEEACLKGSLGIRPGLHLMGLALAHAGRLNKFGA
ncbi:MAG: 2,3-bisphosphoglycerate-independent phosphoglycerate mutase [Syntrophales bacterium]|jgi:2,3-bisphosphoglycerate-independent phosphoglycerate mutase|nr:2,3-bisphosphoglycerate-independent phosphoglycerate mutase [Syntrophales bacterium]MDY0044143.1 2,3-bisphosphoglycerate-independent phosphoglycerate mutase [Syntrophales bacterium]